jgi:CheY-like chemotaxis protein
MTPTALRRDGSYAGRRALIVDDNATNLLLMTALLSAWGVETRTASSGEEALALLEQAESRAFAEAQMQQQAALGRAALTEALGAQGANSALCALATGLLHRQA